MVVLGIDLSLTATGIIRLEDETILDSQLIKTKKNGDKPTEEVKRLVSIVDQIKTDGVELVAIEGLAFMARNTSSLVQLSALNYFVRKKLMDEEIPFVIVAPSSLKKFITGKGNSGKDIMFLETYKRYGESFTDDNLCDAFALSKVAEALINKKIKPTKFQEEVLDLVRTQL